MYLLLLFILLLLFYLLITIQLNTQNKTIIYKSVTEKPIREPINIGRLKMNNSLNRIYNPLRFPEKSQPFFNYPNINLPANVIGLGGRSQPGYGGSQIPILNPTLPINISDRNIAPINIQTQGPESLPQQVGVIQKIFGNDNEILPLFGRQKLPRSDRWEYYTLLGRYGVKMNVINKHNFELNDNDTVTIKNQTDEYRVTIYVNDSPKYVPYY